MIELPAWLLVFPVLGFLIFIHEMGHFLTAKWFGITVKEFGFGFPPRLIGLRFTPNGTIYSINWLPLGGFVRMVGEHGDDMERGSYAGQKPDKNVILVRRGPRKIGNFYDMLAVRPDATQEEIDFAYREMMAAMETRSPERRDSSARDLHLLYGALSTPEKRAEYDKTLDEVANNRPLDPIDYYDFFDVKPDAPQEEIDAAYNKYRQRFMNSDRENRGGWLHFLKFIHDELSDPVKRAAYNKRLTDVMVESGGGSQKEVSFADQSVLKRTIVLCAGSFMNLLFPVIVFAALFALPHDAPTGSVAVVSVAPGSPAEQAGITPGDSILAVNGKALDTHNDLIREVFSNLGSPTELTLRRGRFIDGSPDPQPTSALEEILTIVPRVSPPDLTVVDTVSDPSAQISLAEARRYDSELQLGDTMRQGAIGVRIGTFNAEVVQRSYPPHQAVAMSLQQIGDVVSLSYNGIRGWAAGGQDPGLAGPVGIARVTGEVAQIGFSPLLQLMAIISISLGVINILPIPALDGGRLLFVLIEWARGGKAISPQREGVVHVVGFAVLIGLIVIITYRDIVNLLQGGGGILP